MSHDPRIGVTEWAICGEVLGYTIEVVCVYWTWFDLVDYSLLNLLLPLRLVRSQLA